MADATQLDRRYDFILRTFVEGGPAPHFTSIAQIFGVRPDEKRRRSHEVIAIATAVAVLLVSFGCVRAQETARSQASRATLPRIEANRNLSPAGALGAGVLTVRLEIREGEWYPEAETGPAVVVEAFAEEGRALQIPGPLIRVPEGTEVRATVRNVLAKGTARVYGLHGRPSDAREPLEIP